MKISDALNSHLTCKTLYVLEIKGIFRFESKHDACPFFLGNYIYADLFPVKQESSETNFMRVVFKDINYGVRTHLVDENFFKHDDLSELNVLYLQNLQKCGWFCPFHIENNNSYGVDVLHMYFVLRYLELKYQYRDARIRIGESLRKPKFRVGVKCDDGKLW